MDKVNEVVGLFRVNPQIELLLHPDREVLHSLDQTIESLREHREHSEDLSFAMMLISHERPELIREGIQIMEQLTFEQWQIQRKYFVQNASNAAATAPPETDGSNVLPTCYYYIAIGWTKLGELAKARSCVDRMLSVQPRHPQGVALLEHLEREHTKDGVIGIAGVAAAAVGLLGFLLAKR